MEKIAKKLFTIIYPMPEFHDSFLEETQAYKTLLEVKGAVPDERHPLERSIYLCALKLLALDQVIDKDNYDASPATIESSLKNNIKDLAWEDLCKLSDYYELFKELKPEEEDFSTAIKGERISYETICKFILTSLLRDIEYQFTSLQEWDEKSIKFKAVDTWVFELLSDFFNQLKSKIIGYSPARYLDRTLHELQNHPLAPKFNTIVSFQFEDTTFTVIYSNSKIELSDYLREPSEVGSEIVQRFCFKYETNGFQ